MLQAQACNFFKKETLAQLFSCEFWEISENTLFTEHLWTTASVYILEVYSMHWDGTQMLKKFPSNKINFTKNALFFLLQAPTSSQYYFQLVILVSTEV